MDPSPPRNRGIYASLIVLTILAGLSTRGLLRPVLGPFWASNLGDMLWAVLVFLLIAFLRPRIASRAAALLCATTATGVELSQLYHAPWIEAVRRFPLGGLVLGWGFAWGDLLAYYFGAGACWVLELALLHPPAPRSSKRDR